MLEDEEVGKWRQTKYTAKEYVLVQNRENHVTRHAKVRFRDGEVDEIDFDGEFTLYPLAIEWLVKLFKELKIIKPTETEKKTK